MEGEGKARSGFTTGTCAAAAAKAAVCALFSGTGEKQVSVVLPSKDTAVFPVEETVFLTEDGRTGSQETLRDGPGGPESLRERPASPESLRDGPGSQETLLADRHACGAARCGVRKDAGDDPDVTDGVTVFATVRWLAGVPEAGAVRMPEGDTDAGPAPEKGAGHMREEEACMAVNGQARAPSGTPCYREESGLPLLLAGGEGIGVVTKEGLSCPVGYHAINPVPRRMILACVDGALRELFGADWSRSLRRGEALYIEISIPAGVGLARKTFNPNLGIRGGISVLGTTGIVNPMSEPALVETIRLDIRVRAAQGRTVLAVAPGNYGEAFLRERLELPADCFVKCSNFVGDTFLMMREEGIGEALLAGHLGKLVKVAGGVLNTHSRYGDRRMEILSGLARESGEAEAAKELLTMNTAEEAALYLRCAGCLDSVMALAARRVKEVLERCSGLHTEVVIFTQNLGILSMTEGAGRMARELNR